MDNIPSWHKYPINVLGLSTHSYNTLRLYYHINTLGDLAKYVKDKKLVGLTIIGTKMEAEIVKKFDSFHSAKTNTSTKVETFWEPPAKLHEALKLETHSNPKRTRIIDKFASEQTLEEATQLIKNGHRAQALPILNRILAADPYNELAWVWMAVCEDNAQKRLDCLKHVLKINPKNDRARNNIDQLEAYLHSSASIDEASISQIIHNELQAHGRPLHYTIITKIIQGRYPKIGITDRDIQRHLRQHSELFERVSPGVFKAR